MLATTLLAIPPPFPSPVPHVPVTPFQGGGAKPSSRFNRGVHQRRFAMLPTATKVLGATPEHVEEPVQESYSGIPGPPSFSPSRQEQLVIDDSVGDKRWSGRDRGRNDIERVGTGRGRYGMGFR